MHSLHKCHLEELDLLAKKFLKKWLGVPARGATSEGIFSPLLLGVKPVSQTYLEGHISAYINSILVADKLQKFTESINPANKLRKLPSPSFPFLCVARRKILNVEETTIFHQLLFSVT